MINIIVYAKNNVHDICHHVFMYDGIDKKTYS